MKVREEEETEGEGDTTKDTLLGTTVMHSIRSRHFHDI